MPRRPPPERPEPPRPRLAERYLTQRLVLRPLEFEDAARVSRFTSDPAVARMVGMIPLPHPRICAEGWIQIMKARAPLARDFPYAVELPGEGMIGCIGVHARGEGERARLYELGYWFGRPYWGEGFATEAAKRLAAAAQALGQIIAGHYLDNPASGRVLEKAGFVDVGRIEKRFSLARAAKVETRIMALAAAAGEWRESA
ncbi:MAG: GNAT family N-acetyltransferase [Hydrogenophilaceae bacterium]|nr:GNAT family N-acetyltransferase [Hydrogenophilaceae bacterium]